uniref:Anoctamin n=1 Tax=Cyprinodon variegatus TaxID=28743 RepID=A0A3Q2DUG9_CYPVA
MFYVVFFCWFSEYLRDLINAKVFVARFCLHEVKLQLHIIVEPSRSLVTGSKTLITKQDYFGEKVALYFLWLGWYTFLLIPPALIGVLVFLYGLSFFNTSPLVKEVCESNRVMCPLCDEGCKVWKLSETCSYAKVCQDVCSTMFLEMWKRHRATYISYWKMLDWSELEEELILEVVNDAESKPRKSEHSYGFSTLVLICVTLMVRNLHVHFWLILSKENQSFAARERNFTVKMFTFQFFTYFSSLFYVAFFLGRINGHPGKYVRIAELWRLEECHPSGCLTDLFIQMTIIMVLKQTISNMIEITVPWLHKFMKKRKSSQKLRRKCGNCYKKDESELKEGEELCDNCKLNDWQKNYQLTDVDSFSLFNEFLEMVIQFSFTTIFVAAFPLAPLFALINNVIEIRLDAIKMVTLERRMFPKKTNDIGIWTDILEVIGVLAVIVNGLIIGVSSDFIPRLLYRFYYGPCANGTATDTDCIAGYINNTLSTALLSDSRVKFDPNQLVTPDHLNATSCSYKDYRDSDFNFTPQFWLILSVRFAFVILFEHVLVICKFIAAWFIPPAPIVVKNEHLDQKHERLLEQLK